MKELISVITPTYNAERFIEQTYQSLLNQDHTEWEWLVTDDCSTDSTLHILYQIAKNDNRVKIESNDINQGAAVTRNKSLNRCSGKFVAFLDSDDLWHEKKLSTQLVFMMKNSSAFSFTSFKMIDKNGCFLNKIVDKKNLHTLTYSDMLRKKATLGCSTVMLNLSKVGKVQMPLIRTGQDYGLWLNILKKGHNADHIPEVLTDYRVLKNSISRNKFRKAKRQWQIYREIEKIALHSAIYFFICYSWRAVFRR